MRTKEQIDEDMTNTIIKKCLNCGVAKISSNNGKTWQYFSQEAKIKPCSWQGRNHKFNEVIK